MAEFKYAAIIGSLGQISDRYMTCGYKSDSTEDFTVLLQGMKKMNILTGVELSYSSTGIMSDAGFVKQELNRAGLVASFVNSSLFGERIWQNGSLTARDPDVREKAVESVKQGLDFTRAVGAEGFNIWLGQDGFDYPFQTDYADQWDWLVESLKHIADYAPDLKISIEPKIREPRNRSIIDTVSTALLLCHDVGRDNLGITIDIGHTLQAGQNIAQNIVLAHKHNKLFNLHVNDNYGSWDDDMIVGSVHLMEFLEMMYFLDRIGYSNWISVDIFPFREDSLNAARECILHIQKYNSLIELIGNNRLSQLIQAGDITETLKIIRETIFK